MKLFVDNEKRFENKGAEAWKEEQMKAANGRVNTFVKRWTVDRIPFSGFLISTKNDPVLLDLLYRLWRQYREVFNSFYY